MKVYLVDDDEDIRASLSRSLTMRGYLVESHESAAAFLAAFDPAQAGCVILDYGLPGMNGLELQAHLAVLGHATPVIFVSGHGGVPESVQAIKAGALDFLEKPFRPGDLVDRIEAAFALTRNHLAAREDARRRAARLERLTAREQEILAWIVAHPAAVTSKEVAAHLGISPRTVDHHRSRILEKLGLRSVSELIAWARE